MSLPKQNFQPQWSLWVNPLGIGHGAFLLTSILGGDVPPEKDNHFFTEHQVWYRGMSKWVNSFHQPYINEKPSGASVLVTDPEGDWEKFWIKDNICAIVWHPERMLDPFVPEEILEATGLTL